jgi:hypothetical protein
MAFRIGDLEVKQLYMGSLQVTEMFFGETELAPIGAPKILQESGYYLLAETGDYIALEQP